MEYEWPFKSLYGENVKDKNRLVYDNGNSNDERVSKASKVSLDCRLASPLEDA